MYELVLLVLDFLSVVYERVGEVLDLRADETFIVFLIDGTIHIIQEKNGESLNLKIIPTILNST